MTRTEVVDVCVIGSGAGGGVIAHEAARRGLDVVVLERGPDVGPEQTSFSELEMSARLYKDGGLQLSRSLDMFILQGSCVGGGTVLSNMVLLRPQPSVFDTWRGLGAPIDVEALDRAYDEVEAAVGAREQDQRLVSESNRLFLQGGRALGLQPRWMKKALGACLGCGNCNVGCAFGTKQDARATWITWARQLGARVLPLTEVHRIRHHRGRICDVLCTTGVDGAPLRVRARQVVVAAGAIGSSALLLRSGITKNVGTRLSFNAGSMMCARFDDALDAYDADQMNVYLLGDRYCIEATHNPVMAAALTTPGWLGEHAALMRDYRRLAYAGALVQTEPVGRVRISRLTGEETVSYRASQGDVEALKEGLRTIGACFLQAGAREVLLPTTRRRAISSPSQLDAIGRSFTRTGEISFGTSHPQGGNPWSEDPELGVVDRDFAVHGFDDLYVCDASVFPSCIGVNPIDTIMALSKLAAERIFGEARGAV